MGKNGLLATFTTSWIGRSLEQGRFLIGEKLGEGGMAIVFKAQDLTTKADVVIKVPKQNALEDQTFLKRFAAENRALMNLRHPHVVSILHVGEFEGWPFTVLEYLPGGDLEACRQAFGGKLTLKNIAQWVPKIAGALDFIHGHGYIHRDVKPANILFDGQGRVFLSDFGVAKVVSTQAAPQTRLTGTGMVLGTPDYMAPELIMDRPISGKVDQYALGMTIYECLAGRLPFQATAPAAILVMQTTQKVPPLEVHNPAVPEAVSKAVMKALAKRPSQRFPTCSAFAEELLATIPEGESTIISSAATFPQPEPVPAEIIRIDTKRQPPPVPPASGKKRERLGSAHRGSFNRPGDRLAMGIVFGLGLIVALLIWFSQRDSSPPSPPNPNGLAADSETLSTTTSDSPTLLTAPFDTAKAREAQQAWARSLGQSQYIQTNSLGMKMVLIPPGEFLMGSPENEKDRSPDEFQHRVRITKAFSLGQTEITQGQWQQVMQTTPWEGQSFGKEGADYPATHVSWEDAQEFCQALTAAEQQTGQLSEGWAYALPSEAQWEYACRAGTATAYHFGEDEGLLDEYAWFRDNAYDTGEDYTHPVGQKQLNPWGLFDMHGNVWEWCADWYASDFYEQSPVDDPKGPSTASLRLFRGGCWQSTAGNCRSAYRSRFTPDIRLSNLGFRVAIVQDPTIEADTRPGPFRSTSNQQNANSPRTDPNLEKPALLVAPFDANTALLRQEAWARYFGNSEFVETNSIGMKLVLIPPGEFLMGSTPEQIEQAAMSDPLFNKNVADDEQPQHRVRITQPFYMGQHEVTVGQFTAFVDERGYKTEAETDGRGGYGWNGAARRFEGRHRKYNWKNTGFPQSDTHPVVNVTWNDAQNFCEWLSTKEGETYRLPTEAEWEYACRAGTTSLYYHGDDPEGLAAVGNVPDGTAKRQFPNWNTIASFEGFVFTAPVGCFRPNAFGLHDMHGNAWEWCADWFTANSYLTSEADDPQGPETGIRRVYRGGGWGPVDGGYRSANRGESRLGLRLDNIGFRVVRVESIGPGQ